MKIHNPGIAFCYFGTCETCNCQIEANKDEMFSDLNTEWDEDRDYDDYEEHEITFIVKCRNPGCTDTIEMKHVKVSDLPKLLKKEGPTAEQSGIDLEVERDFKLHYWVRNNGDDSVTVIFTQTEQEATEQDEKQTEPFAESSVGSLELEIEDGQILFQTFEEVNDIYQHTWKPLELA